MLSNSSAFTSDRHRKRKLLENSSMNSKLLKVNVSITDSVQWVLLKFLRFIVGLGLKIRVSYPNPTWHVLRLSHLLTTHLEEPLLTKVFDTPLHFCWPWLWALLCLVRSGKLELDSTHWDWNRARNKICFVVFLSKQFFFELLFLQCRKKAEKRAHSFSRRG